MSGTEVLFMLCMFAVGTILALGVLVLWDQLTPRRPRPLDDKPEHDVPGWDPADVELMRDRERDQVWGQP